MNIQLAYIKCACQAPGKVNKLKSIHVHVYTYTSVGSDLDQYVLPLQHDSYHVFLYMRIDFL